MDQSASLRDQDEVWLTKLALLGCTVNQFGAFYFIYNDAGQILRAGGGLPEIALEAIEYITYRSKEKTT